MGEQGIGDQKGRWGVDVVFMAQTEKSFIYLKG